ncbi:MAG: hypothetical protein Q8908_06250, partial [Bacteroidota bacterium]|nr:hypothetical protein [Bacteroidota bacterium]
MRFNQRNWLNTLLSLKNAFKLRFIYSLTQNPLRPPKLVLMRASGLQSLHYSLVYHCIGDFNKSGDIGSFNIINV